MADINTLTRQISRLSQTRGETAELAAGVCALLHTHISADVILVDEKNKIIYSSCDTADAVLLCETALKSVNHTQHKTMTTFIRQETVYILWSPLHVKDIYAGGIIMYRQACDFDDSAQIAVELVSAVLSLLRRQAIEKAETEQIKRAEAVKAVINTLSFSELEAMIHVIEALNSNEGLLITGKIADRLGMTRSVVVNALRKLEGAGIVETRSLGMKGTYIRIKDILLTEELNKLRR